MKFYNWNRYWYPRGGEFNLTRDGFLYDPESNVGKYMNPDLKPLEELMQIPCLILLGEPGTGKSTIIKEYIGTIKSQETKPDKDMIYLDLRSIGSEQLLLKKLFETAEFQSWLKGEHILHVYLDSLDECLLRVDTVGSILTEEFRLYPIERLFLRIACRTADWPLSLEKDLVNLWGEENVKFFELAPLRKNDVVIAARDCEVEPEIFIREICKTEAVPFAIKPVTLSFLLNIYKRHQILPLSQIELYHKGCELLCTETNQSRRDKKKVGNLSPKERMIIAGRIAAVTIFSNKYAIWTGIDAGDVAKEDITLNDLSGGSEICEGLEFKVNEAALLETLGTGLFSSRGPNRLGWAHQTYAEYLAAWYLFNSEVCIEQILSLLKYSGLKEEKVVPLLAETAAWIASMSPEVFFELLETDPEVLLRSDIISTDSRLKLELVKSLLSFFEQERLHDLDFEIRKRYKKLAHPGIVEQLRSYICDKNKGVIVRRVAIDIAEDCHVFALVEDLINIALDQTEVYQIRIQAACAISVIGDDAAKSKLLPLAKEEAGDDPNDELKGYALRALWPNLLSAKELFQMLRKPKRKNYIGSYVHFFYSDFIAHVSDIDIIYALQWVQSLDKRNKLNLSILKCINAIIFRAWALLTQPVILNSFAQTVISRLRKYEQIAEKYRGVSFYELAKKDVEKRQILIHSLVDLLNKEEVRLLFYPGHLIFKEDFPWLLKSFKASNNEELQRKWAEIIRRIFVELDPVQVQEIYELMQENAILTEFFNDFFAPVAISSTHADILREYYIQDLENIEKPKKPLLKPTPAERTLLLLEKFEAGELNAWWQLNHVMRLMPDGTYYSHDLESDLTSLPVWNEMNSELHERILAGAKNYLIEADPETSKWIGTNRIFLPAYAGYRALRLINTLEQEFLGTFSPEVWTKWAPIILAYPTVSGEDENIQIKLVEMAFKAAPQKIINALMTLIEQENRENNNIYVIRKMRNCWGHGILEDALLAKLKELSLKKSSFANLLYVLLQHGVEEAESYAQSLLKSEDQEITIIAGASLLSNVNEKNWECVWSPINKDVEFGKKVFYRMLDLSIHEGLEIINNLDEGKLSMLYIWLEKQFPSSEDPKYEDETMAHFVGPRESVAHLRDSILRIIVKKGTKDSCQAIARIQKELPYLDWLKWKMLEAQSNMLRGAWVPINPGELLKLVKNKKSSFIQSGEQLLECILESLTRLEVKLQGETPSAIDLWNYVDREYTPKDENAFSDYVKRHLEEELRDRGIIVNREVEIRRGYGESSGERTDIIVDAVVTDKEGKPADVLTVIIETKGCWHKEVLTAIQTQLADRYLRENQCKFGLYLVGWFNCKQWSSTDYRLKEARKNSYTDLVTLLTEEAQKLSNNSVLIKAKVVNASLR